MDNNNKKVRLYISGMTCVNCQNKIENALNQAEGIISAKVSYTKSVAEIVYDENRISLVKMGTIVKRLGYEVTKTQKRAEENITSIISILLIIISLYVTLEWMGILNLLVPSQLADTSMGYGMLFVIGLITSVHCIAMCGGIALSQSLVRIDKEEKLSILRPTLSYNIGRVVSYTIIGFVLGLIGYLIGGGTGVGISTVLQGSLKIIAGLFMVIMGINMLGIFPWLRKYTIRTPRFLVQKIGKQKLKYNRPFIVGLLNGFMPCGPLQSMWIVALASANPIAGALSMLFFSVGTVPLMLGFGSIVSALGKKFTDKIMTIGAILVVVLGLAMLSQGGSLSGLIPSDLLLFLFIAFCVIGVLMSIPFEKESAKYMIKVASLLIVATAYILWGIYSNIIQNNLVADSSVEIVDGVQIVNSTLSSDSYPNITVKANLPVKWIINAPKGSINGCNNRILIQDYGIEHTFQTGENIIEFYPTDIGTVRYSCWMGMIRGNIYVIDDTENNDAQISDQ